MPIEHADPRLARVVRRAYAESPFYREVFDRAGIRPEDVRVGPDLARLPILTPGLLRERLDEVVSRRVNRARCPVRRTSGTTGEPLRIPTPRGENIREAWLWTRLYGRQGLRWWHRQAKFAMPHSLGRPPLWFRLPWFFPRRRLAMTVPAEEKIAWLERERPQAVFAYASVLFEIALALENASRRLTIPLIFSSSDPLAPPMRALIEDRLGGRVWDNYGTVETGPLAGECGAGGGYHVLNDSAWIEVVDDDGRPARRGRIVCTSLWRRATPILRYAPGDGVEWTDEPCPCGRPGPRLLALHGRERDILRLPGGQWASAAVFSGLLSGVPGVRQFRVLERPAGLIEYHIVVFPGFEPEGRRRLEEAFRARFGSALSLRIECVDALPVIPGQKRDPFVRLQP